MNRIKDKEIRKVKKGKQKIDNYGSLFKSLNKIQIMCMCYTHKEPEGCGSL